MLNPQGDVVGLIDASGAWVTKYTYNAWGEILTATSSMAEINPLRYRGYYYDTETGFYYLQSRYYDPVTHRFINADTAEYSAMAAYSLNDTNLFSYCGNNPVNRADDGGEFWNIVIGAVVGAVSEIVSEAIDYAVTGDPIDWGDVATEAVGGAIYGGIVAGTGNTTLASAAANVTSTVIYGIRDGDSAGEIALKATGSLAVSLAPKAVNKLIGGKYAKLNRVGRILRKATDGPYVGKFLNKESAKLADSIIGSGKRAVIHIGKELLKVGVRLVME